MPPVKPIRGIQLNRTHPLAKALIGCWLFNEGSGDRVSDLSGNRRTGTLVNGASWTAGLRGSVVDCDSAGSEYTDLGSGAFVEGLPAVSVSMWANIRSTATIQRLLSQTNCIDLYWNTNNFLYFGVRNDSGVYVTGYISSFTPVAGDWHHFVGTYDGAKVRVFVDCVVGSGIGSQTGNTDASGYNLYVARRATTYANLQSDGLLVWKRALTLAEVAALYRDPFAMFEQRTRPEVLYIAAGGIVYVAGTASAQSGASGSIRAGRGIIASVAGQTNVTALGKVIRQVLGGTSAITGVTASLQRAFQITGQVNTVVCLSVVLTTGFWDPWLGGTLAVERAWLREVLYNGMTANSYKLTTVLTLGWFWLRVAGCAVLHRGPGMDAIDVTNILTVANIDSFTISPPEYVPHKDSSTCFYVLRRFNKCGYPEHTLCAAVRVSMDMFGNLEKPRPNTIFHTASVKEDGKQLLLTWFYCPIGQNSQPVHFKVYYDGGTGEIDYESPVCTVAYRGRRFYSYRSATLSTGRHVFAIEAVDAAGVEGTSSKRLGIQLREDNPEAIKILVGEVI